MFITSGNWRGKHTSLACSFPFWLQKIPTAAPAVQTFTVCPLLTYTGC